LHTSGVLERLSSVKGTWKIAERIAALYERNHGERYSYRMALDKDDDL